MLAAHHAYFFALNMVGGQEIFLRMSIYLSMIFMCVAVKDFNYFDSECYWLLYVFRYVRQRMGRNKLKSFGPIMCRMAMLVHVRSGSFFFKALGITLLFMAGFPDDMVQRETKYRNLDLLQKYYRYLMIQLC